MPAERTAPLPLHMHENVSPRHWVDMCLVSVREKATEKKGSKPFVLLKSPMGLAWGTGTHQQADFTILDNLGMEAVT